MSSVQNRIPAIRQSRKFFASIDDGNTFVTLDAFVDDALDLTKVIVIISPASDANARVGADNYTVYWEWADLKTLVAVRLGSTGRVYISGTMTEYF